MKIWDMLTKDRVRLLRGHENPVSRVAWSTTGRHIASASKTEIKIWDAATGELSVEFEAHDSGIRSLAWSRRRLASAASDGTVRIWNPASGELLHILAGHYKWIKALAWSPDGKRLASGGFDHDVKIWNAVSGKLLHTLPGHTSRVNSLAWHPGGRRLASYAEDKTVRLWDTTSGQEVIALRPGEQIHIGSLAWNADGRRLMLTGRNGVLKVWDAAKGFELAAGRVSSWGSRVDQTPTVAVHHEEMIVAINFHNRGLKEQKAGNPGEAARWYRKERELREKLFQRKQKSVVNQDAVAWSRLGKAFYRIGQWNEAQQSLLIAISLRRETGPTLGRGGRGARWWYLTMTLAQLGQKEKARLYFDQLDEQLNKTGNTDEANARLRAEAAELLGVESDTSPPR